MTGLIFNFEDSDITIDENGSFCSGNIDNQTCALIVLSQVCSLTSPEVGVQFASRVVNRKERNINALIAEAERAVTDDGGRDVKVTVADGDQVLFKAKYDD